MTYYNKNYYPTPQPVIDIMLEGLDLKGFLKMKHLTRKIKENNMDYFTPKLNATEAREQTKAAIDTLRNSQRTLIHQIIQKNIKNGRYKCSFEGDMYVEIIEELRNDGFTVNQNTDIDFLSFNISW